MKASQLAKGISGSIDSASVGNRLFTAVYGADAKVLVFVLPTP